MILVKVYLRIIRRIGKKGDRPKYALFSLKVDNRAVDANDHSLMPFAAP